MKDPDFQQFIVLVILGFSIVALGYVLGHLLK